ncbi:RNA polymerase III RPC4-domain-containing protein [Durotheca rogersii]|uniref:RNA polymerase III RPC4-domain-containing protein n=1 Tax=Durotheca rogersii TaxID=419775 RepID=UPI00221EABC3|nr:RNA polymerase III RPC4-domain-containing protein [Durotheca rogersii]KAI5862938.1 RNA polymerase III RPC4-domain-containing protein [Durotheca rogersii]
MPPRGARGGGARGRGGRGAARASRASDTIGRASLDTGTPLAGASFSAQETTSAADAALKDAPTHVPPAEDPVVSSDAQGSESTAANSRRSQTPAAAPPRGGSRFKPRNVRRDAAERAMLEEARNRDLAIKIKAEEREQRVEERRARRGRGRGDASQRRFIRRTVTASGPFSAIPADQLKAGSGGFGWSSGGGGGAGGGTSSKAPFGAQSDSSRYKPRREHESRVNMDLLNGFTGYDENGAPLYQPSRYSQKPAGSLPVGLIRIQHEEEAVKVKTTAELEAEERQSSDVDGDDDSDLFVSTETRDLRDVRIDDDNEVWHAAPKSHITVKAEPGTDPESMVVDIADIPEVITQQKAPPSPEAKKKPIHTEIETAAERRKRKDKASKDPEVAHAAIDLEAQLRELKFSAPANKNNESGEGGGEGEGEEEPQLDQEKDNLLYLFQLPPILPPLAKATHDVSGETETVDLTSQEKGNESAGVKVKIEEGTEPTWNPFSTLPPEGGFIGKLNVRKSGRVELDWGGTILNLGMGAATEFLTSALMVEQNINLENPSASTGSAYGMGEVMGKYVLAPIWDEEKDWDPSLDDIDSLNQ